MSNFAAENRNRHIAMDNSKILELGTMPVGKLLWKYSVPAVIGMVVMSLYNIVDRIFIGQGVGADAISGLAITFPLMNISAALGTLIGVGAAARVSIEYGKDDQQLAKKILGNSLTMTLIIAIAYTTVFYIFLEPILRFFGASDVTLPYAYDYMFYLLPGFILTNLSYSFNNIMRASGYPKKAMITMILGAVINVALDPIFILVLDMGIRGAAIATVISMLITAIFVMWHFCNKSSVLHFTRGIYRPNIRLVWNIMTIGASPFLINLAGCCINILINNTLYKYGGDVAIGAAGIFNTYTQTVVMIVLGICQGLQPIIGYNYGAHKYERLRSAYFLAIRVSSIIFIIGAMGSMFGTEYVVRAFTVDPKLISASTHALRMATFTFWTVGVSIVSTTLFQSVGDAWKSIFLSLTRQVIYIIPIMLVLPRFIGLDGVWLSFPLSDLCTLITTIILVKRELMKIKVRMQALSA